MFMAPMTPEPMFMLWPMPLFGNHTLVAVGFGQSGKQLLRRVEAEIMQHQHHFLPIGAQILGAVHDQWGGHQALFLHALMRVHPERACDRRIIIRVGVTRRDRRRLRPGKAVLGPGRQLAKGPPGSAAFAARESRPGSRAATGQRGAKLDHPAGGTRGAAGPAKGKTGRRSGPSGR